MTDGDIQFGDIETRPVEQGRRPDEDREYAVVAYGDPDPDEFRVYIALDAFADIETHADSDTSVELGGVLLGKQYKDDHGRPFVWITDSLRAKHYESSISRFTYTAETWSEINREQQKVAPDVDIVGWYHTHPGWGIFLSGHDTFIHEGYFAQPLDTAYVVDPVGNDRGFFYWRNVGEGRELPQAAGFYVVAPRDRRAALEDTVSRVEGRRMAEHGGGGSPIIVQTAGGGGGRGLLTAAGMAVLSLLVVTQLGVLLAMYTHSLEGTNVAAVSEKQALTAKLDQANRRLDKLADLDRYENRLNGERDALRVMLGELKVSDGEPFLRKYEESMRENSLLRRRAGEMEGNYRVLADSARLRLAESDKLTGELNRLNAELTDAIRYKTRADEAERKLQTAEDQRKTLEVKVNEQQAELARNLAYVEAYRKHKDSIEALEQYEADSARGWNFALVWMLPAAVLGWGASLFLYRRLGATRNELEEMTAKVAKPPANGGVAGAAGAVGEALSAAEAGSAPSDSTPAENEPSPPAQKKPGPDEFRIDG